MPPRRLRKGTRPEAGASSLELLVFFPLLLLIILVTVQVALSWYGNEVAMTAARETARSLRTGSHDSAALAAAEASGVAYAASTGGSGLTNVVVDARATDTEVTVTVSGEAMDIVGGLAPRVNATVTSPVEEFREDV